MAAKICPRCGGSEVNCPVCGYPPRRMLPKADIYTGRPSLRALLLGALVWEVQGIDVSRWNGQMNFAITRTKCQYVTIRYGYGDGWKDASADGFYRDARANDMPVAAYWFCNIGQNPTLHADGFADELATKPVQLEHHLDYKRTVLGQAQTLAWIRTADSRLKARTGKYDVPYTSMGFWNGGVARDAAYWINRKLWDATWTTRDYPTLPLDFNDWLEWQWDADHNMKAAEYGSTGGDPDMDLNRYHLTVALFNAKYGTHITPIGGTPPPPPPPGTIPEMVLVNTGEMNIRYAPDPVQQNMIGTTKLGQPWYPEAIARDQFGKEWYKCGRKVYIKKDLTRLP